MGEVFVQLNELSTTPKDLWFKLQGGNLRFYFYHLLEARGSIRLRLTFISEKGDNPTDFTVKGATITKLIEKMTLPYISERCKLFNFGILMFPAEHEFIVDFLLTYRSYLTPPKLLEQLVTRYRGPPPVSYTNASKYDKTLKAVQNRFSNSMNFLTNSVGFVIWLWLEKTTDFNDGILQVQLNKFITLSTPSPFLAKAHKKLSSLAVLEN